MHAELQGVQLHAQHLRTPSKGRHVLFTTANVRHPHLQCHEPRGQFTCRRPAPVRALPGPCIASWSTLCGVRPGAGRRRLSPARNDLLGLSALGESDDDRETNVRLRQPSHKPCRFQGTSYLSSLGPRMLPHFPVPTPPYPGSAHLAGLAKSSMHQMPATFLRCTRNSGLKQKETIPLGFY